MSELVNCIYCGLDTPELQEVPAVDNDEAWERLALEHEAGCEWIATRAHRRDYQQTMLEWTVKIRVSDNWVADGFDLTEERLKEMVENSLPFAYPHETEVAIVDEPDQSRIRRIQGYAEQESQ